MTDARSGLAPVLLRRPHLRRRRPARTVRGLLLAPENDMDPPARRMPSTKNHPIQQRVIRKIYRKNFIASPKTSSTIHGAYQCNVIKTACQLRTQPEKVWHTSSGQFLKIRQTLRFLSNEITIIKKFCHKI